MSVATALTMAGRTAVRPGSATSPKAAPLSTMAVWTSGIWSGHRIGYMSKLRAVDTRFS
ncbi:MAG: hypothetical protein ACX93U_16205 [Salipiger thiooxidans]|uniref:hypothetical protein n=1 Tax=Salipiger thiooxidans TaxID=282683 RepID=UPI001CF9FDC1|nr:hypothetical protein [Salipiger thiooxidans]